jgi:hypothetical protein
VVGVLPDGLPTLSHPTNEDLFVGTPIRRSLRDFCTLFGRVEGLGSRDARACPAGDGLKKGWAYEVGVLWDAGVCGADA